MAKIVCGICDTEIRTMQCLSGHVNKKHEKDITVEDYYRKYIWNGKYENECKYCGQTIKSFSGMKNGYSGKPNGYCTANCCKYLKRTLKNPENYSFKCKLCKASFHKIESLSRHIAETHKKSTEEYYNTYLRESKEEGKCKWCQKPTKFTGLNGYTNFCYNTACNVNWYNEHGDRHIIAGKAIKETYEKEPWRNTTNVGYYTRRGHTEEEAKKIISKRQTTFSKEICIEKHGEGKGLRIWQARQEKWLKSFNDKTPEEMARINRAKCSTGSNVSKAELELKDLLKCDHQFHIPEDHNGYVYDLRQGNKIIEYNGDYWHCNPEVYSKDYYNQRLHLTSEQKWAKDKMKIESAREFGYEVLIIWEKEYKENQETVVQKCLNFLKE